MKSARCRAGGLLFVGLVSTFTVAAAAMPLRCGGAPRPGLASLDPTGTWTGLEVELCRAAARAIDGPDATIVFRSYESVADVATAHDDALAFLTGPERRGDGSPSLKPLRSVAVAASNLTVKPASPYRHVGDLAGRGVCVLAGTTTEDSLQAWMRAHGDSFVVHAFQEDGEMADAYDVGRCEALAVESITPSPQGGAVTDAAMPGRVLGELASEPVIAFVGLSVDAAMRNRIDRAIKDVLGR